MSTDICNPEPKNRFESWERWCNYQTAILVKNSIFSRKVVVK